VSSISLFSSVYQGQALHCKKGNKINHKANVMRDITVSLCLNDTPHLAKRLISNEFVNQALPRIAQLCVMHRIISSLWLLPTLPRKRDAAEAASPRDGADVSASA
jgi:hypothetical protein